MTPLPPFPIDRMEWQNASSDKLKVGVPVREGEWNVLSQECCDKKLEDIGFKTNENYCLRLVDLHPNRVTFRKRPPQFI